MKKASITLLICFFCMSLTACDPSWYTQEYEELSANAVSVELINYDYPYAKIINDMFFGKIRIHKFDFSKMEVLETLSDELLDDFFKDWSEIILSSGWFHSNSAVGISIRIIYSSGDFDVFSFVCNDEENDLRFGYRFHKNGYVKKYIGQVTSESDFVDIINKYFETDIEDFP